MKRIFLFSIILVTLSILLAGCMNFSGPEMPSISFSPSNFVAGQTVKITVQSNDLYSNLTCALSIDGQTLQITGTNDTFIATWTAVSGVHTIVATVTDSYNHSSSNSKIIDVSLPYPPKIYNISISPSNPQGGQIMSFTFSSTSQIGLSSEEVSLDSHPLPVIAISPSTFLSTSTITPGNHTISINVSDKIGTTSSTSIYFTASNYPYPQIKNVSWTPQYPSISNSYVTFKVSGYDPIGFTPYITVDDLPLNVAPSSSSSTTYVATWTVVAGYHTVNVILKDSLGWFNEKTYHIAVTPQTNNMVIEAGITPSNIQHGQSATITAVVYNYYPPMKTIRLYIDGGLVYTAYSTDTLTYRFNPSDGFHTVTIVANDNFEMQSTSFNFNVSYNPKSYPPYLSATFTPYATTGIPKILTVKTYATAPGASIQFVNFYNILNSSSIGSVSSGNNNMYAISWTPDKAGVIPIRIESVDSNNTISSTIVNLNVLPNYINNYGPIIYPYISSLVEQSDFVTFGASVLSQSKIANVEMWIDNIPLTPSKSATGLYTINWIASATGTHLFKVYAQDILGRSSTSNFYFYVYPGTLPEIQAFATPVSIYLGGQITLGSTVIQSSAAINYVNFYVDGNEIGSVSAPPYILRWTPQVQGSHTLMVEAVNAYGKKGYSSAYFNVFKDTTPPNLEISAPSTASTNSTIHISARATDLISGINYLELQIYSSIDPQPYPNLIPIVVKNFKSNAFEFDWQPTGSATYTIYVMAYDNAGNMTKRTSIITVK
ncbi:Ig-like domain-containing protein [Athalassotoga saccharophila]|uniref:Ig-like domain-containing protein n=1 Tax=Athalassotoga saccharophila TaxID=1441386 RepID=UPI00137B166F|nr:Ig-like domain-containing protein [Athalassotoga saccharophila]BBJ27886.1 chitinase [Athalassotoga saccharophila]